MGRLLRRRKQGKEKGASEPTLAVGKSHTRVLSQADVIGALEHTGGRISHAAKYLGTSFVKIRRFMEENKAVKDAVKRIEEAEIDFAEKRLRDKIAEGNMTAIIFYLKCKGKGRGFIEDEKIDLSKLTAPVHFHYNLALPKPPEG